MAKKPHKPKGPKPKGVYCRGCFATKGLVVETVRRPCPGKTVRYRKCKKCGTRRTTTEK